MEMERKGNKRFYIGVILIVIGGILILERLDLIPWDIADLLISWQMLLIAIGVFLVLGRNVGAGIIFIGVGGFFILPEITTVPDELKRIYGPLVLVVIGLLLLFRHKGCNRQIREGAKNRQFDQFDDFVIFGGREIFINAQDLKGGRATSIFGGIEYDLRQANLASEGAIIDCICIFGGTGIKVPANWIVKNEVTTIFGAFSDKRGETFQQTEINLSKTLVIKGITLFGGVEVKLNDSR
jgi:predicted membrane protein